MKPTEIETAKHAINIFSFLIDRNEKINVSTFLERIKQTYDIENNQQNRCLYYAIENSNLQTIGKNSNVVNMIFNNH